MIRDGSSVCPPPACLWIRKLFLIYPCIPRKQFHSTPYKYIKLHDISQESFLIILMLLSLINHIYKLRYELLLVTYYSLSSIHPYSVADCMLKAAIDLCLCTTVDEICGLIKYIREHNKEHIISCFSTCILSSRAPLLPVPYRALFSKEQKSAILQMYNPLNERF